MTSMKVESGNTIYDSRNNCNAIIETSSNTLISGCINTTIPNSVTSIGHGAFKGCSGLTSVTIPNSVTSIGVEAFSYCSGLTSVTIPNSVTSIRSGAFRSCSGLTSVTIPNSLTIIEYCVFEDCSSLTAITIPKSVWFISTRAFANCSSLTSMKVESGNTKYDSRNNCNAIIETSSNTLISGCINTTIPNSVTSIGQSAFWNCSGLTSVTIPESVTSIGDLAFVYCSDLTSVIIPNSVTSIGNSVFADCSGLTSVTIPESVTSIGQSAFRYCSGLTSVIIPESVTSIGKEAFSYCSGLTSITIPESVTSIGDGVFQAVGSQSNPCMLYAPDDLDFGGVDTSGDYFQWKGGTFKLVTEATITISSAGVGTFCYDKDLDFSNVTGLKAYIATGYNRTTGNVIVQSVNDVPAGTGIYLKGAPGTYKVPFGESGSYYLNMLVGTTEPTTITPTDGDLSNLLLKSGSKGVGFYGFTNETYTVGANKAYLQIPTSMMPTAGANYIGLEFEEGVTGIDTSSMAKEATEGWYTVDGRKLNGKPTRKGVYVNNGHKIVIK